MPKQKKINQSKTTIMENQKREWSGFFIPRELWETKELKTIQKILFIEVSSYSGGCWKSNKDLASRLDISPSYVSELLTDLKRKGYISIELKYKEGSKQVEKRTIRSLFGYGKKPDLNSDNLCGNYGGGIRNNPEGYTEISDGGIRQKPEDSNTLNSNTISNKKEYIVEKSISPSDSDPKKVTDMDKYRDYIRVCNKELAIDGVERKWRAVDEGIKSKFLARLKEGYTGKDFINAMRAAKLQQNHIESGFKYLTPEFFTRGDKLQMYANMIIKKTKEQIREEKGIYV